MHVEQILSTIIFSYLFPSRVSGEKEMKNTTSVLSKFREYERKHNIYFFSSSASAIILIICASPSRRSRRTPFYFYSSYWFIFLFLVHIVLLHFFVRMHYCNTVFRLSGHMLNLHRPFLNSHCLFKSFQ